MKLKNIIFGHNSKSSEKYPKEENIGEIFIDGDKIICKGKKSFQNCEINIKDMQYAYIIVNTQGESSLFIVDHHQNKLPTNFSGFSIVYEELSSKYNFDDDIFFENVHKETSLKKQIWRKKYDATYEIIDENYNDYALGFEIQSPKKEFVNWDETYDDFLDKNKDNLYFDTSPYGQKICKFTYPIRIGNIIVKDIMFYSDNGRTDVPILNFYSHCIDTSNSDKSYFSLKEQFQKDFSKENHLLGYERDDQNSLGFKDKGILFSLVYTYDSDYQFDGGYTSFSITNQRTYPDLLVDSEYEKIIEVSEHIVLNKKIKTPSNYKKNSNIKRRPEKLLPTNSTMPIIWIDNINLKIGFADKANCQTFDQSAISSLTIQNILPAKGPGASYLQLNYTDKTKSDTIFSSSPHMFDSYKEEITKLTGLKIKMAPEYYDC